MVLTRVQTIEIVEAIREFDSHCLSCLKCDTFNRLTTGEACPEGQELIQVIRCVLLRGAVGAA